jgi:hypothetical protein
MYLRGLDDIVRGVKDIVNKNDEETEVFVWDVKGYGGDEDASGVGRGEGGEALFIYGEVGVENHMFVTSILKGWVMQDVGLGGCGFNFCNIWEKWSETFEMGW